MLQNAYSLSKIGTDTAENEQHFAQMSLEARSGDVVVLRDVRQLEGGLQVAKLREGEVPTYIFSNFYSNVWLIFGKL